MENQEEKMELTKKKILVIGASGLFGLNYINKSNNLFEIICNINKKKINNQNLKKIKLNFKNEIQLRKEIKNINPDFILNAAGLTDIAECEKNKNKAYKINFLLVKQLVKVSNILNITFIQISTDHIFDGTKKDLYLETDIKNPINYYAKTKSIAENYIINFSKKYLIIRTNFFGWGASYRYSFSDYIIKNLSLNKKVFLNDDIYFNPMYLGNLIECINILIKKKKIGIFNITSDKKISKFTFAKKLAKYFELDASLIKKNKEINIKKPKNMALNNKKVKKIIPSKYTSFFHNLKSFKEDFVKPFVRNFYEFHPYGKHHLFSKDISNVIKVLKSKNLTQGPSIQEFENKICNYVGSKYAVVLSSCSAGLHLSCKVAGLNSSNKLITSPNTFVSSANAALHCNSNVEFVDIDTETGNISINCLKKKLSNDKKIRVIMPVHFGGLPCDLKKISNLIRKDKKIFVIEDAAHALGAKYKDGSLVGSCKFSDMTVFSFHPVKSIASGEGGVVTTNNYEIYKKLISLRSHGITRSEKNFLINTNAFSLNKKNIWYYEMQDLGFHYRLTDIQAALGISQLSSLDKFINKRRLLAERYDKNLSDLKFTKILQFNQRLKSANHLYILLIDFKKLRISKTKLMEKLMYLGIGTQVHYIPVPYHPYFKNKFDYNLDEIKNSIKYYNEALSIPLYYDLDFKTQQKIIKTLKYLIQ